MFVTMMVGSTSADGLIIGNFETDIQIQGLTELNVRTLISRYFSQRKAYLQGAADTINVVVAPMVADEAIHKEVLTKANAVLSNSTAVINTVLIGDYIAEVTATETVAFVINDATVEETIVHIIYIYKNSAGYLIVSSDGYTETTTGFVSASYINTATAELADFVATGAPECIVDVTMREIGYTEGTNGYNKYGAWYDSVMGTTSFAYDAWCVTFVSWCANQASVPTSVIPIRAYAPYLASDFRNMGRYYKSAALGGSYTPQPGDIIFMYGSDDSPGHVGIVSVVNDGVVYYVDGNADYTINGVTVDRVSFRSRSLTSTDIVAYANPGYTSYYHTTLLWEFDDCYHWAPCEACGMEVREEHHMISIGAGNIACEGCGYMV